MLLGQYVGDKKPNPDRHIKIFSFDERVAVLPSITKPKKMTIRGNDGHEYRYLVKGGEDLR
jgi:phosphatidylinositol kinase/protein kinase (PI-3  family)